VSKLLIPSNPLVVIPELAKEIGVGEAAIVQQIHYWLDQRINKNKRDGRLWVYNTYEDWQKQFPWMSIPTLKRKIQRLEALGLVVSCNYNDNLSRTKWYTLNYEQIDSLVLGRTDQNDPMERIKMIPSTITETTTEITNNNKTIPIPESNSKSEAFVVCFNLMLEYGIIEKKVNKLLNDYGITRCMEVLEYARNGAEGVQNIAGLVIHLLESKASLSSKLSVSTPIRSSIERTDELIARMKAVKPATKIPDESRKIIDNLLKLGGLQPSSMTHTDTQP